MLNRNVSLALCLSVIAGSAFAQSSNQGTGYIFEFANAAGATGQFQAFLYNTQSLGTPVFGNTGPVGANQVIPKPDGSKFYIVGSGGVDDFNPAFATPASINGILGSPTQAIISPDGRFLLVASSLGSGTGAVYILNTLNDAIALTQPISGSVIGMVVSHDSTTAWILGASSQAFITTVNLTTGQQVGAPVILRDSISGDSLGGNPQALTLSPFGLLYVSAGNQILEFNPSTLQSVEPTYGEISVLATAGALQFSVDGSTAYFVNTTPQYGGQSLLSMTLPTPTVPSSTGHTITSWPPFVAGQQPELFDSIVVAAGSNTGAPQRLFAHSPNDTTLWDVSPDLTTPLASCSQAVCPSALNSVLPATSVLSMAFSNELPSAQYLYALVGSGTQASIYRVALSTNTVTSQASAVLGTGTLQFAIVPPETNPTNFITYDALQPNLAVGATALPLIARVLDPVGRPMFAVPVTFTGDPSLKFTAVTSTTNKDGYAQATVTLGQTPGAYPVTLTAGSGTTVATTTFSLTIPGGALPTGPTSGPNQMTIISGNGQLFRAQNPNFGISAPLTIQLLATDGKTPLVNQDVTFTIVGTNTEIAALDIPNAITDQNGMAYTDFFPQSIGQNIGFVGTTVTAVATQGAVTFYETVWQPDANDAPVSATVLVPSSVTLSVGEGDVVPGAIVGVVSLNAFGTSNQIPNVAINITAPDGSGNPGPATCQGNPLSDVTGTVTCNLIASCSAGVGLHGFTIDFGNSIDKLGYALNVTAGSTQALAIQGGNKQSGRPGAALSLPLVATVTDQCGTAAQGVTVTWKVTQGSATLSAASTASNQGGTVSTLVTLGQTPGTVTIVASINATATVTYTETVQAVVGGLTLVSGGGQVVLLNQAFVPIVFQVSDTSKNPVPGILVNFGVASGSATISTPSQTTNAQGQVSVNVIAGNVAGPVTITATYSAFTASASLTVTAPGPAITLSSFVNAASGQAGLTPCGLALVTGTGLAPSVNGIVPGANVLGIGQLPTSLAGVTITVNGTPAPLQAVSNQNAIQQVNFQTPCETVPGSPATVVVQVGSVTTQVTGVTVYPAQPGIFTSVGASGMNYGYVIDGNGNAVTSSNLAQPGQTYYMFTTGLGQTTPAIVTNSNGTGLQTIPVGNIILAINNIGVPVTSVQYREGTVGEYLITFTIPVPFAAGTNETIALGVNVNSQTFYDNSQVALPGIN
jgi:uncharacterized protein (TIGR03437 family)